MLPRIAIGLTLACCLAAPAYAQRTPAHAPTPPHATAPAKPAPVVLVRTNPLLPPAIPIETFYIDLSLLQKAPNVTPAGFDALYTPEDWSAYRQKFGAEADNLTKLKASGQTAFAEKLVKEAVAAEGTTMTPGLRRLLLIRAAAIASRNREGFPTADKAVLAYEAAMNKKSAAQVAALWTLANQMSRTAVTPKPDRIRYDGIAAKANMQLALLLLDADQVEAAQAIIKQVAYHEGWLKSDPETRARIAMVRSEVKQTAAMMDYLATQYQPALHNDVHALTMVYLYGRYVKENTNIVADLPGRVPDSPLAQLAASLDAATNNNPAAAFAAAQQLQALVAGVPDPLIKQRTLYATLKLYETFSASPQTERDRVHRTLARMAREAVISDGARKSHSIDPFAPPAVLAAAPAPSLSMPSAAARTFVLPAEDPIESERAVIQDGHEPWRVNPEMTAQAAVAWAAQQESAPPPLKARLLALSEQAPRLTPPANGMRSASWEQGAVVVALTSSRPTNPDSGIWLAKSVSVVR